MNTKEKIYKTAAQLFLERGYDNTPMSHIAKKLNISKAALYHHYLSKEDLLFDIINYYNETIFLPVLKKTEEISDPEERLSYFFKNFVKIMTKDETSRIAVHEARRLNKNHLKKTQETWRMTYDLLKNSISELKSAGKIKDINSSFAAFAAIGMASWTLYWFDYSRHDSREELIDTFMNILLHGVKS